MLRRLLTRPVPKVFFALFGISRGLTASRAGYFIKKHRKRKRIASKVLLERIPFFFDIHGSVYIPPAGKG